MKRHRYIFITILLSVSLLWLISCSPDATPTDQTVEPWGEIVLTSDEAEWLAQKHTVRVRISNWPPFMFADDGPGGIAIDHLETIFDKHGIAYEYVLDSEVSWPEALEYIKNHEVVDLVPTINRTAEREEFIVFTQDYLFLPRVIFTRDDADFIGGIDDLLGKTVSVEDGYVTETLLEQEYPEINRLTVKGSDLTEQALAALASGQVDAYVGNLAVASYLIDSKGLSNIKVAAPSPFPDHNQEMGIRDDWPELATIINKSLNAMPAQQHADIRNRWLSVRYEYGISSLDVIKWVAGIVAIALLILGIILFWNRRLQRELAERKRIEGELFESERRFREMLENVKLVALMLDTQGRITFCNDFLLELTDWKRDEVLGKNWFDMFLPPELDLRRVFGESVAQGRLFPYIENEILTRSNERRLIMWNNTFLRDANGQVIGTASIGEDITEQKRAELIQKSYSAQLEEVVNERTEELEAAQEELIRNEKLATLGQLAGSVGHELRNPLGVISNAIYFLKMLYVDADETTREYLDIINNEVSKSEKIISDLLNFSRTRLIQHVEKESVDIANLIASTLEEHPPTETVKATVEINADLPPVFVDPQQIGQVMVNLITNAYQAMPEGGDLHIDVKEQTGQLILSVKDTGHGIPAENMEKLFEPLFTTKSGGIGLGLCVSRNLVEANGGQINVTSDVGKGTTFSLTLPIGGGQ